MGNLRKVSLASGVPDNLQGIRAKHNNHVVPAGMLKRWLVDDPVTGHWLLDCRRQCVRWETGREGHFAIRQYQYVPVRATDSGHRYRDEEVEDWFMLDENHLASGTDKLLAATPGPLQRGEYEGLIRAAIVLGFRSAYEYKLMRHKLHTQHPEMRLSELGARAVSHYYKVYRAKLKAFAGWDYTIFSGLDEPLLLCDRPLFDVTLHASGQDYLMTPLAPDLLLFGCPPAHGSDVTTLHLKRGGAKTVGATMNRITVGRAREFIVGPMAHLEALLPRFSPAEFSARKATDRTVTQVLPHAGPSR